MMTVHKAGTLSFRWLATDPTPTELQTIVEHFMRGDRSIELQHKRMWTSLEQGHYQITNVRMEHDEYTNVRTASVSLDFLHDVTVFSDTEKARLPAE